MKFKRLVAFSLGLVMTVQTAPAFVFAKELDPAADSVIAAEEEKTEETEETQPSVKETEVKKETSDDGDKKPSDDAKEDSGSKDKAPADSGDKEEPEKEDKEPAQTEAKEPEQTESKEPIETETKEPESAEDKDTAETETKETEPADEKEPAETASKDEPKESDGTGETKSEEPADTGKKASGYIIEKSPVGKHIPSKTPDNKELLETYFKQKTEARLGRKRALFKNANSAGNRLSSDDRIVYESLKTQIAEVASGLRTSTVLRVPMKNLGRGWEKQVWTAADLGVSSLLVEDPVTGELSVNQDATAAFRASHPLPLNIPAIDNALLADCPYELYWFDKTLGVTISNYTLAVSPDGMELFILYGPTASFVVSEDYASGTYITDSSKIKRVTTAVSNAAKIVSDAANKTDSQKLNYYYQKISSLVSYDNSAAGGEVPYGDPWQIISVFDGNTKTNVVCEGYAKAFMYLCELTVFNANISCITVTGDITPGGHMWNVVNMDDGKNYIVDITNVDGRGSSYYNALFLAGYVSEMTNGYYFTYDWYFYDEECLDTYDSKQLAIANHNYYIKRTVNKKDCVNGSISVDKTSAKPDEVVTVTATPDKGYEVDKIKVNGSEISGNTFYMTGVPATVEATFKLKQHKVTVNNTEGGTVTASPDKGYKGETVTLTVSPEKGYALDKIICNDQTLDGLSFTFGDDDVTITPEFKKVPHSITVNPGAHGTASADLAEAGVNDTVTLTVTPDEGYYAKSITVNGEPLTGTAFAMLPEAVTVNVEFDLIAQAAVGDVLSDGISKYIVTNNAVDGTGTVAYDGPVNPESSVTIHADVTLLGIVYKITRITSQAFRNNTAVTSVYIGANIVTIDGYAFMGCSKLTKISGGAKVKTIGTKAFANCPKLKSFTITSKTLSKISSYAFYKDKNLKTVTIKYTTKLTKKGVKKSLKSSSVKTVKVKKSKVKKYKKYFTKKNAGRKVKVKK